MKRFVIGFMIVGTVIGCKTRPKYSGSLRVQETLDAQGTREKEAEPVVQAGVEPVMDVKTEVVIKEEPKPVPPIETPIGPSTEFPYTIEVPKEPYSATIAADNSCQFVDSIVQRGNKLTVSYKNFGAMLAPNSPTYQVSGTLYRADTPSQECRIWTRIKNVPAGYKMVARFSDTSGLKLAANLRAYAPDSGDYFALTLQGHSMGMNPAAANGRWYAETLNFVNFVHRPQTDLSDKVETVFGPAQLVYRHDPYSDNEACPTAAYEMRMYLPVIAFRLYSTTNAANLPNDGFSHSLNIKQLPEIQYSLVKCN